MKPLALLKTCVLVSVTALLTACGGGDGDIELVSSRGNGALYLGRWQSECLPQAGVYQRAFLTFEVAQGTVVQGRIQIDNYADGLCRQRLDTATGTLRLNLIAEVFAQVAGEYTGFWDQANLTLTLTGTTATTPMQYGFEPGFSVLVARNPANGGFVRYGRF